MFEADPVLGTHRWPLVRVRGTGRPEVVLLSRRFFSLTVHWSKTSIPCCGEDCKLCEILPARGLFFVAVACNSVRSLLELGSQSAMHFEQHAKFVGGAMVPGQVFELSRKGAKQPVRADYVRFQDVCKEVDFLDLARHVMAVFKFPCPNPGETIDLYEERCRRIAKVRCDRHAEIESNAAKRAMR